MNKLGRNKTLYLKRQGCVFKESKYSSTEIWTDHNEYVNLADLGKKAFNVNFIYKHRLTNLMSINRAMGKPLSETSCNTVSIGFSEKEQKWYGWTHRGYGAFGIGYEIVEGFKVETLDQAKKLAIHIANYLD